MNSTVMSLRQTGDGGKQFGTLLARHAGGRLVEQQHLGSRGQRQRDLQKPLLTVSQLAGLTMADGAEHQRGEDRIGFIDIVAIRGQRAPPGGGDAAPLANRERNGLKRAQMWKQSVDLKGSNQPALDALIRLQIGDVVTAEANRSGVGAQHPGQEVDQRGLAGAIGADQGVAGALRDRERDAAGHDQRAETLVESRGGEGRRAHDARPRQTVISRCSPPRIPFGSNITTTTSSNPIQKYQYCGLIPEN